MGKISRAKKELDVASSLGSAPFRLAETLKTPARKSAQPQNRRLSPTYSDLGAPGCRMASCRVALSRTETPAA